MVRREAVSCNRVHLGVVAGGLQRPPGAKLDRGHFVAGVGDADLPDRSDEDALAREQDLVERIFDGWGGQCRKASEWLVREGAR